MAMSNCAFIFECMYIIHSQHRCDIDNDGDNDADALNIKSGYGQHIIQPSTGVDDDG